MKRLLSTLLIGLCTLCVVSCSDEVQEAKIITTAETIADGEWQCFSKECFLFSGDDAELRIAADTKYWLWINGELVVREGGLKRGPNPKDSYIDVVRDIPQLGFGYNQIVVLVQYYGRNSFSHRPTAMPGLYFDLSTTLDRVVSDESWSAMRYDAMWAPADENPEGHKQYRVAGANVGYDARKALDFANFDGSTIKGQAVVVSREESEWGEFVERPIPLWRWSELRDYVSTRTENGVLIGKLPYNAHVTPYIKLRAKGGERIVICTDDYWIGPARAFYTEYIAREGEQEFETPIWTNGHEVLYHLPEGVEVVEVKYRESGYDSDFVGSFECDNEFCNTLWTKAQRTLYVTMRDNYMDCPDRERAQWWGDVVVELGEAGYVFDERAHQLTRKAIIELMSHQREDGSIASPVPGWYRAELPCQMLASVGYYGFYTYYMQTGDVETIKQVYDGVRRYLFHTWDPQNSGLIKVRRGGWYWGDWGKNIDKEALQQCWYGVALQGFAKMAALTGHKSDALMATQMYDKMRVSFNEKYWDEATAQYKSANYKDAPDDRVQAMAVIAGFTPKSRYESVRKFLNTHYNASPYMEKYVLEALCKMDFYDDALKRMEARFGTMVRAEYSTLWEGWEYTGARGMTYKSGNGTYNHAWSGGGLTILSEYIAGIAPIEAAFARFKVCPNLASLQNVKSVVPTKFGQITMSAKRKDSVLVIDLTVPENTEAVVELPHGYKELRCNTQSGSSLTLAPGVYTIIAQ